MTVDRYAVDRGRHREAVPAHHAERRRQASGLGPVWSRCERACSVCRCGLQLRSRPRERRDGVRVRLRLRDRFSRLRLRPHGFAFTGEDFAFFLIGVLMTFGAMAVTAIGSDATGTVASGTVASGTTACGTSPELPTLYSSRSTSDSAMTASSVSGSPASRLAAGGEEES